MGFLTINTQRICRAWLAVPQRSQNIPTGNIYSHWPPQAILEKNKSLRERSLFAFQDVTPHLPMAIGDYTDFYAGENYAYNVSSQHSNFSTFTEW